MGKLRHQGVKLKAGRAGVGLILPGGTLCPQAPPGEPGRSRRPRWGGADGGGVQTMRLFQNRRRKVLAPGPGARGGGRGGLGVRWGPHQHPAPPNPFCRQEGAPTGIPEPLQHPGVL